MTISDDIKARLDIVDVITGYVPELKQAGRSFKARCPFHQEQTPSFVVFPERQSWRCFGACATGGDIFSFVMRAESVEFPEALRSLAHRAGVEISEHRRQAKPPQSPLVELNEQAQRFFRDSLRSDRGALARTYLTGRGLSEEAIATFGLGYSPSGSDEVVRRMEALGFEREKVVEVGLAMALEDAPVRDMFRGRLTFPIRDESGDLVGFGARALDGAMPKYLNTPQTKLFDKSRLLYGMDKAGEAIGGDGRRVVVVEGYMDVIAAHEAGFRNVVASMGTALTLPQVESLLTRADTVVLALDADEAGQGATYRNLLELAQRGATATIGRSRRRSLRQRNMVFDIFRVASLPIGKDPDELIRADASLWRRTVDESPSLADFLVDAAPVHLPQVGSGDMDRDIAALSQVVFASHWSVQDRYVQRLAALVGTTPERLEANLERVLGTSRQAPRSPRQMYGTPREDSPFRRPNGDPVEEHALALLVHFPEMLPKVAGLPVDRFQQPENRAVLSGLQADVTMADVRLGLDGPAAEHLDALLGKELPEMDLKQRDEALESCLRRLEIRFFREIKLQEQVLLGDEGDGEPDQAPDLSANQRLKELYAGEPSAQER